MGFVTGVGGFLQALLFGYLGLLYEAAGTGLLLRPHAPPLNATELQVRGLRWRHATLAFDVNVSSFNSCCFFE